MTTGFASYPQGSFEDFVKKLEEILPELPRQEAKLAQSILLNLGTLSLETGKSLALKVGVAEVTVGRLLRRLGCNGMRGLRQLLRQQYSVYGNPTDRSGEVHAAWESVHDAEVAVVTNVFQQTTSADWQRATELLTQARTVYVSGFQSVRGIAEDFSRRLSLARGNVHYLSPHDGMLGEWLEDETAAAGDTCLFLLDVVPYASESSELARLASRQGRGCIVLSDEYCHWSREIATAAIYTPSRTGLFLESTVGLVVALGLLVDAVAASDRRRSEQRLAQWKANARKLGLF
jgi:DNA-binding MurR/RpiR family transcriptional regulator